MSKIKKEIVFRPMFGYPKPKTDAEDKDETIRQLRASIKVLAERDAKRLKAAREGMKKFRAKPKT
jgi:hypothetical protein